MKKPVLVIIIVFVAVALIVGGLYLAGHWNKPLGESISMPTRTGESSSPENPEPTSTSSNSTGEKTPTSVATEPNKKLTPTTTLTPTEQQPVCGGPKIMYILAMGVSDDDPDYLYGLADAIRVIRLDFVTPKVTVLTIPRDMWVEIPHDDIIEEKKASVPQYQKINTAYFYGGQGMGYYEGPGNGPGLLARTIALNYDLYVDHYVAINWQVFEDVIDAMGGVDVYLNEPIDGRPKGQDDVNPYKQGQGYFPKGWNHLTGFDALSFVRIRDRYTETIRTDNQTILMCAVKEKLTRPEIITGVPKMISSLLENMQTDLTLSQIRQLTCLLPKLEAENLQFVRFPDDWMVQGQEYDARLGGNTFVWDIPIEDVREFYDAFEADTIPPVTDSGSNTTCP
ncbi:MAG: LCP family protein [Anaerolineaceae bacterium]